MTKESAHGASAYAAVAKTALWTAAARARESARPDRLFDDPFAAVLAGDEGFALLSHFHTRHASDEGNPFLPIRTRWFDDYLAREVREPEAQVVALGAGLDTRALRLDWPERTVLFEVDQAALLDHKEDRLAPGAPLQRCDRRVVRADLAGDWLAELLRAGFEPSRPTVWFAEGLFFYLPEGLAHTVLTTATGLSAPGSHMALDLIGTKIFTFPYMRHFLERLEEAGSPWVFGTDRPDGFVRDCGWSDPEVSEPGRPGADFGRWPQEANPAALTRLPRSYLVTAHISGR
ncbi:class I SAM-dependent methyltransferase [Streptomyces sp. NPDC085479]|uniref:class I SAM-dependent methyltransferase n=1 Tax=Streptomyces sp. NPDC085479 TaxID=3365726 RepID=UPI0037D0271B